MNTRLKILGMVSALLLVLVVILSGCSAVTTTATVTATATVTQTPATSTTPSATATTPATRIVMDKDGNAIEIPYNVERVAPQIGAMAHMTALLGYADKIVCAADANLNARFRTIFPQYVAANPKGLSTSNVEDVIASRAQVLYGPITDAATIEKYKAANIAVVPLNTFSTVEQMKDNIRKIAEILGGDAPAKAEAFCEYYDAQIAYCNEKTGSLTKVKILSLSYAGGALNTINSTDICSVYMAAAGGVNVAGDIKTVTGISTENVIQWSPEVIITMNADSKTWIMSEPTLQTVPAVKNDQVYVVPWGTYLWSVRSAEGAMMPLWLAKIMHGADLPDLDMYQVVRDYYSRFYNYTVSDTEIAEILAGQQPSQSK
jgi:iron complex transport system substrate-binding protein